MHRYDNVMPDLVEVSDSEEDEIIEVTAPAARPHATPATAGSSNAIAAASAEPVDDGMHLHLVFLPCSELTTT